MSDSPRADMIGRALASATIPSLVRWGVTVDGDLVFRTLVGRNPLAAHDLAAELGLPTRRITAALEELVDAGAAHRHPHGGYLSLPPDIAVERLRQRHRRRADERVRRAAVVRSADLEREVADAIVHLGPGVHHLTSRDKTRERLSELAAVRRREHLAINPEPNFEQTSYQAGRTLDRQLINSGVQMRVLGTQAHIVNPTEPEPTYRVAARVPMKLLIIDRRVALFPVDPANYDRGYLEIQHVPVVQALLALFERHWVEAAEPEVYMPTIVLSQREQALVTLLAAGHTDASAARELRLSERSISNIVRSMMDRLGVDNRFQLGLALGSLRLAAPTPGISTETESP